MASNQQPPSNLQTYGVPIYAVDWILEEAVRSKITKDQDDDDDDGSSSSSYIVLSGGGGEGRSGIPNVILICRVDLHTNSLSEQPVSANNKAPSLMMNHSLFSEHSQCFSQIGRRVIGTDLPYRMAIHPRQGGLICALPNSCRLFDWENIIEDDNEEESEKVVKELKDVGQQLSLSFNQDGTVLATGAEVGRILYSFS